MILVKMLGYLAGICIITSLPVFNAYAGSPAPVPASGQTTSYVTGDDGEYQSGVEWPSPRFVDNNDGTVTDLLTNLVWLKDAGCVGLQNWNASFIQVASLANGSCELSDNSTNGEWRIPNVLELFSLIDVGNKVPALPDAHPFIGVASDLYWSSTSLNNANERARPVHMSFGDIDQSDKTALHYVWPVRDLK